MMNQCGFTSCNKCTTLVRDVDSEGCVTLCMCGGGRYLGTLYLVSLIMNLFKKKIKSILKAMKQTLPWTNNSRGAIMLIIFPGFSNVHNMYLYTHRQ